MDNMLKHIIESQVGKTVILASPTGSRLYGINRLGSDYDFWVVVLEGKKPRQTIVDGIDTTVVPLHTFTSMVTRGVPQALEVLWSPLAMFDTAWKAYLDSLTPDIWQARYRHLALQSDAKNVAKSRMTRTRLALNAMSLMEYGRYNPVLSVESRGVVVSSAHDETLVEKVVSYAKSMMVGESCQPKACGSENVRTIYAFVSYLLSFHWVEC